MTSINQETEVRLPHQPTLVSEALLAENEIHGSIDPPKRFGLDWTHHGEHSRYGHTMNLWVADGASDAYRAAWKRERDALTLAGFSWTSKARSDDALFAIPCWWERRDIALDRAARRDAVERALAAEAERAAHQEAERIRREAEVDERIGARVAVIRARLAALLATSARPLGRGAPAAAEHLELTRWDEWDLSHAERLLSDAAGNAARAEASHALALLHGHRRQIPVDLGERIFSDAPQPSLFLL